MGPEYALFDQNDSHNPDIAYFTFKNSGGKLGRLLASFRLKKAARPVNDVDWWYSPDPDAARVANHLALDKGGRSVFDIHEVYHQGHLARWTFGRQIGWLSAMVKARIRSTCKQASLVVSVGNGVLEPYVSGLETPSLVVRNCAPASFAEVAEAIDRRAGSTVVMHGKASVGNGTPKVLEALRGPAAHQDQLRVLMIVDPENPSFPPEAFESGKSTVEIEVLPPIPHRDMPAVTAGCDVGMISYQRDLGVDSMPNRLFEYMAAGIAIFAPSYSAELKKILDDEQIGITADFESAESITKGLEWLARNPDEVAAMGNRARSAFVSRHSWEAEFAKFVEHLES